MYVCVYVHIHHKHDVTLLHTHIHGLLPPSSHFLEFLHLNEFKLQCQFLNLNEFKFQCQFLHLNSSNFKVKSSTVEFLNHRQFKIQIHILFNGKFSKSNTPSWSFSTHVSSNFEFKCSIFMPGNVSCAEGFVIHVHVQKSFPGMYVCTCMCMYVCVTSVQVTCMCVHVFIHL
jgi:hypothetical protein